MLAEVDKNRGEAGQFKPTGADTVSAPVATLEDLLDMPKWSAQQLSKHAQLVARIPEDRYVAQKAKLNKEVQNEAAENHIDAQINGGELLAETPLDKGGNAKALSRLSGSTGTPSEWESRTWQRREASQKPVKRLDRFSTRRTWLIQNLAYPCTAQTPVAAGPMEGVPSGAFLAL